MKKKKIIITSIVSVLYTALVSASYMLKQYYAYYSGKSTLFEVLGWIFTCTYLFITQKLLDRQIARLITVIAVAILTALIIFFGVSHIPPLPIN